MNKRMLMLLWSCCLFWGFAQEPEVSEEEIDAIIDELFEEDSSFEDLVSSVNNFQFLYLSLNYNSNTYFSGRDIGIDQYTLKPQLSYMHAKGFFASLSGTYFSEFDPGWDYTTTTLGYSKSLGKKKLFRISASYSHYFISGDPEPPFSNSLNTGLGLREKHGNLGTQLTASYLFGEDSSFQLSVSGYFAINLYHTKTNKLRIRPWVDVVIAQQTLELAQPFLQDGMPRFRLVENNIFDLINTQLLIPLQFSTPSFDIEIGYTWNFPSAIGNEQDLDTTSFFGLSVAYMIDL